jgi:hypothetical protein
VRRRCRIGVAHAEVDNVFAPMPGSHFHAIDDAENVGRQSFDPLKFHWPNRILSKNQGILALIYKPS